MFPRILTAIMSVAMVFAGACLGERVRAPDASALLDPLIGTWRVRRLPAAVTGSEGLLSARVPGANLPSLLLMRSIDADEPGNTRPSLDDRYEWVTIERDGSAQWAEGDLNAPLVPTGRGKTALSERGLAIRNPLEFDERRLSQLLGPDVFHVCSIGLGGPEIESSYSAAYASLVTEEAGRERRRASWRALSSSTRPSPSD